MRFIKIILVLAVLAIAAIAGLRFSGVDLPGTWDNAARDKIADIENTIIPIDNPQRSQNDTLWDPANTALGQAWLPDGAIQTRFIPVSAKNSFAGDRAYRHLPLYTFFWRDQCAIDIFKDKACDGRALVMAKTSFARTNTFVDYRYFKRSADDKNTFDEINGAGTITRISSGGVPSDTTLRLDGDRLQLAEAAKQTDPYGSAGIASLDAIKYASMGYHFNSMGYNDPANTGLPSSTSIFAMSPLNMSTSDAHKYAYRAIDRDLIVPWGLTLNRANGCSSVGHAMLITNAEELAEFSQTSFGVTVANFSTNGSLLDEVKNHTREERYFMRHRTECAEFSVVLDKARATLNPFFVDEVQKAANACETNSQDSETCQDAVRGIVETYGTHYANSGIYGGYVTSQLDINETASELMNRDGFMASTDFEQEVTTGLAVSTSGTVGIPFVASADVEVEASVSTNWKSGFNMKTMSEQTKTALQSQKNEKWSSKSSGGNGGFEPENWTSSRNEAVPIYVDLRPIDELLTPPFFKDDRVVEMLRPMMASYVTELTTGPELSEARFNRRRYTAPPRKPETKLSFVDFQRANDEVAIFSSISRHSVYASREARKDQWPSMVMGPICQMEAGSGCSLRVRRVSRDSDRVWFEIATKDRKWPYSETSSGGIKSDARITGRFGIGFKDNRVIIRRCSDKRGADGEPIIYDVCKWVVEPADIDSDKGGPLYYFIRRGDTKYQRLKGNQPAALSLASADAAKSGSTALTLKACKRADRSPECLWQINPRFWGNKVVGLYDTCGADKSIKSFHEGDYYFPVVKEAGLTESAVDKNGKPYDRSRVSQIRVPPNYQVKANGGHYLNWEKPSPIYGPGIHCLKGARDNYFRSFSIRRTTSSELARDK